MKDVSLGELVKKAKGEDRSLRQYAKDAGVDAAIISKIINGSYIPKRPTVFKKLVSAAAAPRGGVTYKELVKAASTSSSYQAGIAAGMAFTEDLLSVVGDMPLSLIGTATAASAGAIAGLISKGKGSDVYNKFLTDMQKFVALSKGLLLSALGEKGVNFQIDKKNNSELQNEFDTYLKILNHNLTEYIIRYAFVEENHQGSDFFVSNTGRRLIEELVFIKPLKSRKVSIVTNIQESYDYLVSYKGKLSYNGELSIIYIDSNNVQIVSEEYVAHSFGSEAPDELFIV